MLKIGLLKENDLPSAEKCFRRVEGDLETLGLDAYPRAFASEESLDQDAKSNHFYGAKEGIRVIASAGVSHDVLESFFPNSKSQRLFEDLLFSSPYQGEELLEIHRFHVDPAYQRKGHGKALLKAILSSHEEAGFLVLIPTNNKGAISFFTKNHFAVICKDFALENDAKTSFSVLAYFPKRDGLCRNIGW